MSGRFASACTVTSCTAAKVRHGHDHPPVIGLHIPIARNPWGGMTINHVCFSRGGGKYNDTVYISVLATMSCVLFFGRWIPAQPSNTAPVQAWHNRVPNKGVVHAVLVTWPQPNPCLQEICWMLWTCPSLEIYNLTEHKRHKWIELHKGLSRTVLLSVRPKASSNLRATISLTTHQPSEGFGQLERTLLIWRNLY